MRFRIFRGDQFRVVYIASIAPAQLRAWISYIDDQGEDHILRIPQQAAADLSSDRTTQTIRGERATSEGWITGGEIGGDGGTNQKRGQFYCFLTIAHGGTTQQVLGRGYFYPNHAVSAGDFVEAGPGGGEGYVRTVTGTNPAAGAEVAETVPTNVRWRLKTFTVVFVADANSGNRLTNLIVDDGATANRKWVGRTNINVTLSQTRTLVFQRGAQLPGTGFAAVTDTDSLLIGSQIPQASGILLVEGDRIRTATDGILAGDDYAAPIFEVEEWIEV